MEKTFNLKRWLEKQANYEGAQGYIRAQTRAWMNCTKLKLDAGMGAQEAWDSCCDEFQKGDKQLGWVSKYAGEDVAEKLRKQSEQAGGGYQLQMGEYWERIKKKMAGGMTTGQAVLATLKECEQDGAKIPSD